MNERLGNGEGRKEGETRKKYECGNDVKTRKRGKRMTAAVVSDKFR